MAKLELPLESVYVLSNSAQKFHLCVTAFQWQQCWDTSGVQEAHTGSSDVYKRPQPAAVSYN